VSSCSCEDSSEFRVTGEVIDAPATGSTHAVGTGAKQVRVRCRECGGKVAYIGSDLLNVLGVADEEIQPGACIGTPDDPAVTLTVDLL
jgi:hypothetical protein